MADVTIKSTVTGLKWQGETAPELRVFTKDPFIGADEVPMNNGQSPFFLKVECELDEDGYVVVPDITLPSTEDSSRPDAQYRAVFFFQNSVGATSWYDFSTFGKGFRVPPSPTTTTWADIDANMGVSGPSSFADRTVGHLTVTDGLDISGPVTGAVKSFHGRDGAVTLQDSDLNGLDGSGLTGITGGTGGVSNTGSTTIGADTDEDGIGVLAFQTRNVTRWKFENDGRASGSQVMRITRAVFLDNHGGVADAVAFDSCAINSGSASLACTGASFTSADVGKKAVVRGAGAAGATLTATIIGASGTTLTLNANAGTTVSGAFAVVGTDNSAALGAAQDAAEAAGVTEVYAPSGVYLFTSSPGVLRRGLALAGSPRGTQVHSWNHDGSSQPSALDGKGTTFLVAAGEGLTTGGFITQYGNSVVRGISFFYPGQSRERVTPLQYPPTLFLGQDNAHTHFDQCVIDSEFINSYTAVKIRYGGRAMLSGLRGAPIFGIDADKMYDAAEWRDIYFNCYFYSSFNSTAPADNWFKYMNQHGVGMKLGRVDGLTVYEPYLLGYYKGVQAVTTTSEGSLPGGSAWVKFVGGGAETCVFGAQLDGGNHVSFLGYDALDSYDSSGGGLGYGIVTTSNFSGRLKVNGGMLGFGSGNTQAYNVVLDGGGQVHISGVYFYNASVNNVLVNSLVGNPMHLLLSGNLFNNSASYSVAGTGYASVRSTGNDFVQRTWADALHVTPSGGFNCESRGDTFLDGFGYSGQGGSTTAYRITGTGQSLSFAEQLAGDTVNAQSFASMRGIGVLNDGYAAFSSNGYYSGGNWNRFNTANDLLQLLMQNTTDGSGGVKIRRAVPGSNPVTAFVDYLRVSVPGSNETPLWLWDGSVLRRVKIGGSGTGPGGSGRALYID